MHGPMRNIEPVPVAFRVDPLEPDGEPSALRGIGNSVLGDVSSVGDRNVPMHLDLDRVEIADQIGFVFDSLQKAFPVVDTQRRAAGGPAVTVSEAEVGRTDAV